MTLDGFLREQLDVLVTLRDNMPAIQKVALHYTNVEDLEDFTAQVDAVHAVLGTLLDASELVLGATDAGIALLVAPDVATQHAALGLGTAALQDSTAFADAAAFQALSAEVDALAATLAGISAGMGSYASQSALQALVARVNALENSNALLLPLQALIADLEAGVYNQQVLLRLAAVENEVSLLEGQLGAFTTVFASLANLEGVTATLDQRITSNTVASTALAVRVTQVETNGLAEMALRVELTSRMDLAEQGLAAQSSTLQALSTRTTATETSLISETQARTALASQLTDTQAQTNLLSTAVGTLGTSVQDIDGRLLTTANEVTSLNSRLDLVGEDLSAEAAAREALTTRVEETEYGLLSTAQSVTQLRSSLIGGGNELGNAGFETNFEGWTIYSRGTGWLTNELIRNLAPELLPPGVNTMGLEDNAIPAGEIGVRTVGTLPIEGSKHYILSAYLAQQNCTGRMYYRFLDQAGAEVELGLVDLSQAPPATTLGACDRIWKKLHAPAAAASLQVQWWVTEASLAPVRAWMFRPMLEQVHADQENPSPWNPGATGVETALATAVETLTTRIEQTEDNLVIEASERTALAASLNDLENTTAAATEELSVRITQNEDGLVTVLAQHVLQLDANGYIVGWKFINDGTTGVFDLRADALRVTAPNGYKSIELADGLLFSKSVDRARYMGVDFGQNNDLIDWYGPLLPGGADAANRTNGVFWLGTDGSAYFGGQLNNGVVGQLPVITEIRRDFDLLIDDLALALAAASARGAELAAANAVALAQEIADRAAADAAEAAARAAAIAAEATARQGDLLAEAAARAAAIAAEAALRTSEIEALSDEVWDAVGPLHNAPQWSAATAYPKGALVTVNGIIYRALQATPAGTSLDDSAYWEAVGQYATLSDAIADALGRTRVVESSLVNELITRANQNETAAIALTALESEISHPDTGLYATAAAVQVLQTSVADVEGTLSSQSSSITALQSQVAQLPTVFVQPDMPAGTNYSVGDVWFDSDDQNTKYFWNGTTWSEDSSVTGAIIYAQTTAPTGGSYNIGDLWVDTSLVNGTPRNRIHRWNGSAWIDISDNRIESTANAVTALTTRVTAAEGVNTSQASQLTSLDSRIDTAETDIDGLQATTAAQATAAAALTTRVTNAEGEIDLVSQDLVTLTGRVNTAETSIDGLTTTTSAQGAAISAVETRVQDTEAGISVANQQITTLTGRIDIAEQDLDGLTTSVSGQGTAIQSLDSRVDATEAGVSSNSSAITALTGRVTDTEQDVDAQGSALGALTLRVDAVEVVAGETTELSARMGTVESALVNELITRANKDETSAIALNALESRMDDPATGLEATAGAVEVLTTRVIQTEDGLDVQATQITTLEAEINDPATGLAAQATAVSSLNTRVTQTEDGIDTVSQDVVALETSVNDPVTGLAAQGTAVAALDTRVSQTEAGIATTSSEVTALSSRVDDVETGESANSTAITALQTRASNIEGVNTTQASQISSLQSEVSGKASSSAVSMLETRVSDAEGVNTTQASQITSLQSQVNDKASSSALTALETRVSSAEGVNTTQATQITNLQSQVDGKASASALSALDTRVTNTESTNSAQATQITNLTASLDGKANVSALTSLDARVVQTESGVSQYRAAWTLALNVNGVITGIRAENTGTVSTIEFSADALRVVKPGGGARLEWSDGNQRVYDANNVLRVRMGVWQE